MVQLIGKGVLEGGETDVWLIIDLLILHHVVAKLLVAKRVLVDVAQAWERIHGTGEWAVRDLARLLHLQNRLERVLFIYVLLHVVLGEDVVIVVGWLVAGFLIVLRFLWVRNLLSLVWEVIKRLRIELLDLLVHVVL